MFFVTNITEQNAEKGPKNFVSIRLFENFRQLNFFAKID